MMMNMGDWSSCNQWWRWCDGGLPAADGGESGTGCRHIAADIAENVRISPYELKKIDAVVEKNALSFKALMEMKPMAAGTDNRG